MNIDATEDIKSIYYINDIPIVSEISLNIKPGVDNDKTPNAARMKLFPKITEYQSP